MKEKSRLRQELEKKAKVDSDWIYRGQILSLRRDLVQIEHQPPHPWEIVVHPGAVAIIPINKRNNLILIKQWRRAVNQIMLEIPAGTLEPNESPFESAQRELQEEIGYKASSLLPIGGFYSSPGFCTEFLHLFIARDLSKSALPQDDHEAIDILEVSLNDALKLIDDQSIKDLKTVTGILQYKRWIHNEQTQKEIQK